RLTDVADGGERCGQVGDRAGTDFDHRFDAERGGHFSQLRELVQCPKEVAVDAGDIDAACTQLAGDIEIQGIFAHVTIRPDAESLAQRDGYTALVHGGDHLASQSRVIPQRPLRIAVRVVRHWSQTGGDIPAPQVSGEIDELNGRQPEHTQAFNA